jgi:hypothetical protein
MRFECLHRIQNPIREIRLKNENKKAKYLKATFSLQSFTIVVRSTVFLLA